MNIKNKNLSQFFRPKMQQVIIKTKLIKKIPIYIN